MREKLNKIDIDKNKEIIKEQDNKLNDLKEQYRKQQRVSYFRGWFFIIAAIGFSLLGFIMNNPKVILGVALQLLAGTMLIIANKE